MTPASLHGELLQRISSCSLAFGSSLSGPFNIRPMLTVSRRLGGISPRWGFLSLLFLSVIWLNRQFRCWVDFLRLCLVALCLLHFLPILWFRLGRLPLVVFQSSLLVFWYPTLNISLRQNINLTLLVFRCLVLLLQALRCLVLSFPIPGLKFLSLCNFLPRGLHSPHHPLLCQYFPR